MKTIALKPCQASLKYSNMPEIIYHYTSPSGLIGIIQNKELWFSRFDCLNDKSEGMYIQKIYDKAIVDLIQSKEIDRVFLESIKDVKPSFRKFFRYNNGLNTLKNETSGYIVGKKAKPYLCCFSKNSDSLPMWNYYTKDGKYEGYNIGFYQKDLIMNEEREIDYFQVIYDQNDQIEIIKHRILEAYTNFTECGHSIQSCKVSLINYLNTLSIRFKNPVFNHEEEFRIVYWLPDNYDEIYLKKQDIYYREKNALIIPYLRIPFNKNSISSVTIGPLIMAETAKETLNSFLDKNGLTNIIIKSSEIPIRY